MGRVEEQVRTGLSSHGQQVFDEMRATLAALVSLAGAERVAAEVARLQALVAPEPEPVVTETVDLAGELARMKALIEQLQGGSAPSPAPPSGDEPPAHGPPAAAPVWGLG